MKRLAAILVWSILAAAFIGPGTVTTAASAGARFHLALLWALAFSTLACLVLQEASARLTIVSGLDLARALRRQYPGRVSGAALLALVLGAIVLGCAAYEAGNILGGVAGAALAVPLPRPALTLLSVALAAGLLWFNSPRRVAIGLSVLVAIMGVAFLWTAVLLRPAPGEVVRGALTVSIPDGSGLLALGLVGTTVVPYNLFLGSGLALGADLRDTRLGLAVAIGLGGVISMGVVVVGTALPGELRFDALAGVLAERLGGWARGLFAAGLFAAGLSSAVTAPLAAAVTARGLFAAGADDPRWADRSTRYRATWGGVLAVGLAFGLSGVRPVPVIVLAQALNGVLLPVAAVFLLLAVNDRRLMGAGRLNGALSNVLMGAVTAVALLLGSAGVVRATAAALGRPAPEDRWLLAAATLGALALAWPLSRVVRRRRRGSAPAPRAAPPAG